MLSQDIEYNSLCYTVSPRCLSILCRVVCIWQPTRLLSLGFSRQEHWSGLPFPSPMHESEKWKWKWSHVRLFETPWTAAYQAPPSMGFPRQEYWSGVPLPSPSNLLCIFNSKFPLRLQLYALLSYSLAFSQCLILINILSNVSDCPLHTYRHTPIIVSHSGNFNDEDQMKKLNHFITQYKLWVMIMSEKNVWHKDMAWVSNSFECVTTTKLRTF